MTHHYERHLRQERYEARRRHQTQTAWLCRGTYKASTERLRERHLKEERHGAFRRHQTQTAWLCRGTHKASTERLREYHLYKAFPRLNTRPCCPFRTIIPTSAGAAAASVGVDSAAAASVEVDSAAGASVEVDSAAMAVSGVVTVVAIGRPRAKTTARGNPLGGACRAPRSFNALTPVESSNHRSIRLTSMIHHSRTLLAATPPESARPPGGAERLADAAR